MSLWWAEGSVVDDPAWYSGAVLVVAPDKRTATRVARKALIESYQMQAGGWGTSAAKIDGGDFEVVRYELPAEGVVMVSGSFSR